MRQSAAQIQLAIAALLNPQPEKCAEHPARDEARAPRDHLAVVNGAALRQRIFYAPSHPDRVVVLDMLWHHGFARSRNCLAQARHAHPGGEAGAEADLFDKFERALLAGHAPRRKSPKVMVTMTLKRVKNLAHPERW